MRDSLLFLELNVFELGTSILILKVNHLLTGVVKKKDRFNQNRPLRRMLTKRILIYTYIQQALHEEMFQILELYPQSRGTKEMF